MVFEVADVNGKAEHVLLYETRGNLGSDDSCMIVDGDGSLGKGLIHVDARVPYPGDGDAQSLRKDNVELGPILERVAALDLQFGATEAGRMSVNLRRVLQGLGEKERTIAGTIGHTGPCASCKCHSPYVTVIAEQACGV